MTQVTPTIPIHADLKKELEIRIRARRLVRPHNLDLQSALRSATRCYQGELTPEVDSCADRVIEVTSASRPTSLPIKHGILKVQSRTLPAQPHLEKKRAYVSPMQVAFADIGLGDKDGAFRWLTEAYRQRDELGYLHVYTEFYPFGSDRRFQDLERSVGLVR